MIPIYVNDVEQLIEPAQNIEHFLMQYKDMKQHFAIAINHQLVPKIKYKSTLLFAGDRVDIIVPMQGG